MGRGHEISRAGLSHVGRRHLWNGDALSVRPLRPSHERRKSRLLLEGARHNGEQLRTVPSVFRISGQPAASSKGLAVCLCKSALSPERASAPVGAASHAAKFHAERTLPQKRRSASTNPPPDALFLLGPVSNDDATLGRAGGYDLLVELATGGMATVYLARKHDGGTTAPVVALKRPHKHLAKDNTYLAMLLDEARLEAGDHVKVFGRSFSSASLTALKMIVSKKNRIEYLVRHLRLRDRATQKTITHAAHRDRVARQVVGAPQRRCLH